MTVSNNNTQNNSLQNGAEPKSKNSRKNNTPKSNNHQLEKEYQLIDKVLEGKSEDVKQQVWEFVARFDIHPDDQAFWALFVVLGYLQLLMTESPEQWVNLFEKFQAELTAWAKTNNKTLEQLGKKTEVMSMLATSSEKLEKILFKLADETHNLMVSLQQQTLTLNAVVLQLKSDTSSTNPGVQQLQSQAREQKKQLDIMLKNIGALKNSHRRLSQQLEQLAARRKTTGWQIPQVVLALLIVSCAGINISLTYRHHQMLQETHQHSAWLLKKGNRDDCQAGIKQPSSPECAGM